jgi:hypothetical protein
MTTYKDIRGTHIKTVTTDPPAPVNGQMWYNSTDQAMKGFKILNVGSWSTVGSINSARRDGGGAGVYNSALLSAGFASDYSILNESWNGTSWTEEGDTNIARSLCDSVGTSSESAILFAGYGPNPVGHRNETESWNGSTWTEVNDLNTRVYGVGRAGTATAALSYAGNKPPNNRTGETESWNGTSWTEVNDLNNVRENLAGDGTSTSAVVGGGYGPPGTGVANTESWNGSSWTEVADLNQAREDYASSGSDNTANLVIGGYQNPTRHDLVEQWNGSSWTEVADIPVATNKNMAAQGSVTNALTFAGYTPASANTNAAYEWSSTTPSTVTFTAS